MVSLSLWACGLSLSLFRAFSGAPLSIYEVISFFLSLSLVGGLFLSLSLSLFFPLGVGEPLSLSLSQGDNLTFFCLSRELIFPSFVCVCVRSLFFWWVVFLSGVMLSLSLALYNGLVSLSLSPSGGVVSLSLVSCGMCDEWSPALSLSLLLPLWGWWSLPLSLWGGALSVVGGLSFFPFRGDVLSLSL